MAAWDYRIKFQRLSHDKRSRCHLHAPCSSGSLPRPSPAIPFSLKQSRLRRPAETHSPLHSVKDFCKTSNLIFQQTAYTVTHRMQQRDTRTSDSVRRSRVGKCSSFIHSSLKRSSTCLALDKLFTSPSESQSSEAAIDSQRDERVLLTLKSAAEISTEHFHVSLEFLQHFAQPNLRKTNLRNSSELILTDFGVSLIELWTGQLDTKMTSLEYIILLVVLVITGAKGRKWF